MRRTRTIVAIGVGIWMAGSGAVDAWLPGTSSPVLAAQQVIIHRGPGFVVVPPLPPLPPLAPMPLLPEMRPLAFDDDGRLDFRTRLDDGTWLRVRARGAVEITDDGRDIRPLPVNGYFDISITSGRWFSRSGWRYTVRRNGGREESRRLIVDADEHPIDEEGRALIADGIEYLVREAGFDADGRVAGILATEGPDGVLDEVDRISSDYVQAVYLGQLFRQATLSDDDATRALDVAARQIQSDFSRAVVLRTFVDEDLFQDARAPAFARALDGIQSDFHVAQLLTSLALRSDRTEATDRLVLEAVSRLGSDFHKAQVLTMFADDWDLAPAAQVAFFRAVESVDSDFHRYSVLARLARRPGLSDTELTGIIGATSFIQSDFHKSQVLLELVTTQTIRDDVRDALLRVADGIDSEHYRGRILSALLRQNSLG